MRRRLASFLAALPLALLLAAAPGCETMTVASVKVFRRGDLIRYEQYSNLDLNQNPKLSVDDVENSLGRPNDMHDRDGKIIELDYLCLSLNDELKTARFHFDKAERLLTKELW